MMKTLLVITLFILSSNLLAEEKKDENVIYEYKKYESFDLGNMEIQGKIIAPGDITVNDKDRKIFKRNLYNRFDFANKIRMDIFNIR